jgi:hypothetical protein
MGSFICNRPLSEEINGTLREGKLNPEYTPRRYAFHSIEKQDIDFSIWYFTFVIR